MSKINRHNYEEFFLDYHEGNLSGEQKAMVILFIESNDDLLEEFYTFKNVLLEVGDASTIEKSSLYSGPHHSNREDYFIGWIEGDLTASEKAQTQELIDQNPSYAGELVAFKKTKLIPERVAFVDKGSLKKTGKVIPLLKYALPAAAAITLFVLLSNNEIHRDYQPSVRELADIELIELENQMGEETKNEPIKEQINKGFPKETRIKKEERSLEAPIHAVDKRTPELFAIDVKKTIQYLPAKPTNDFKEEVKVIEKIPTLLEKVTQVADQKILGTSEQKATDQPLELLAKGIEKVTKKETEISLAKTNSRKKIGFKFGKFEFSRSKRI